MRIALPLPFGRASLGWLATAADNPYSRRVARLKVILPGIGIGLLLLIAIWPRLAPVLERMRFAIPAIDLREARELRMLNPRYVGTDRENRPFVVTAAVGRQSPDHQDLMSLEGPQAEMQLRSGGKVDIVADSGIYQSPTQLLDLFGHVVLTRDNGTKFVTQSARVDAANNTATGHDPVEGHGPSGDVKGEGFHILDKGNTVVFDGKSEVVLVSAKATAPAQPPAFPAAVTAIAARAAAEPQPETRAAAMKPTAKAETHAKPHPAHPTKHPAARTAHAAEHKKQ